MFDFCDSNGDLIGHAVGILAVDSVLGAHAKVLYVGNDGVSYGETLPASWKLCISTTDTVGA